MTHITGVSILGKDTVDNGIPYAKGTGTIDYPLPIFKSFRVSSGQIYNDFTSMANVITLTEQTGVSINGSPRVMFPERTSFAVGITTSLVFDRDSIVLLSNAAPITLHRTYGESDYTQITALDGEETDEIVFFEPDIKLQDPSAAMVVNVTNLSPVDVTFIFTLRVNDGGVGTASEPITVLANDEYRQRIAYVEFPGKVDAGKTLGYRITATGGDLQINGDVAPSKISVQV